MRWDRFFEDLEEQFDAEIEAERAALDSEAERLRIARLALTDRLRSLRDHQGGRIVFDVFGGMRVHARVSAVGEDWIGIEDDAGSVIVPVEAIAAVLLQPDDVLRSARPSVSNARSLAERMTLGFVLRDLARRRVPVRVETVHAGTVVGTIDRAGADHFDLAAHDPDEVRRQGAVRSIRMMPFSSIALIRPEG